MVAPFPFDVRTGKVEVLGDGGEKGVDLRFVLVDEEGEVVLGGFEVVEGSIDV